MTSPLTLRSTIGVSRNLSRALRVPSGWPTATLDRTRPTDAHGLAISGRSDPHDGSDDSRKVIPVGAARDDDESYADEEAEHEIACFENSHAAHDRDRPRASEAPLSISGCQIEHVNVMIL